MIHLLLAALAPMLAIPHLVDNAPSPKPHALDGRIAGVRTVVPGHPNQRFYLTKFWIYAHGNGDVQLVYGHGRECVQSTTELTGDIRVKDTTRITWPKDNAPLTVLPLGQSICLITGTKAFIQGDIWGFWL